MSEEHTSDLVRYAELEKQLAAREEKTREHKKKYHVMVDLELKHEPDHPSIQTSRSKLYGEVFANTELRITIAHEMIAITERLKHFDG